MNEQVLETVGITPVAFRKQIWDQNFTLTEAGTVILKRESQRLIKEH